jgi:hypothetical protein
MIRDRNQVMPDNIEAYVNNLPPDVREIAVALRNVVRATVPDAQETMLWGGISYHTPWIGGRIKGALCQIDAKGAEVRIAFIHGIRLADPANLLCGSALSKRYVPIHSIAKARRPEILALIREASAIELSPGF